MLATSRSRSCQRGLALKQLAVRNLPRSHVTSFRSASAKPPSLAAAKPESQQQRTAGSRHESSPRTRGFATAVDDLRLNGLSNSAYAMPLPSARPSDPSIYDLRPITGSTLLRLPEMMAPNLPRLRITRNVPVPQDCAEALAVLDACLTIGKLDRAALLLKHLGERRFEMIDRADLMMLYNRYLKIAVEQLAASPSSAKADHIHQLYETGIRKMDLRVTPETIAYMLKAALLVNPDGEEWRLKRVVTRYMSMAIGSAGLEVLYMTEILTDKDRAIITKICPTYNISIQDAVADMPAEPDSQETATNTTTTTPNIEQPFPEVMATSQKGFGLKTVKRTLSLFGEIPHGHDIGDLTKPQQREIQARLERDTIDAAIERWREDNQSLLKMGLNTSINSTSLNARLYNWHVALEARITDFMAADDEAAEADKSNIKRSIDLEQMKVMPFLRQSTPARLAAITILGIMSSVAIHGADRGIPVAQAVANLGGSAEADVVALQRAVEAKQAKKMRKAKTVLGDAAHKEPPHHDFTPAPGFPNIRASDIYNLKQGAPDRWPLPIKVAVGSSLLGALLDVARIDVTTEHPETKEKITKEQPAFIRSLHFKKGKKVGVMVVNKTIIQMMMREPRGEFLARHLPMVCEPEPWTRFDKGGYLEQPTSLIRMKRGERDQKIYAEAAMARGDMDQTTKGLDALGRTAWKVNKNLLSVILNVWNSGDGLAGIPPLRPEISVPEEPAAAEDPLVRVRWIKALKEAENQRASLHSQRCNINFQLEIARAYRDQTFYFPHNIDFRGRAYPIPVHFNHMGADLSRSLMLFAKGKPLGEEGLNWLKVHLSNVYGFDKASLSERGQFAVDHMEDIIDSATNPLGGKRWWLGAEDPWQCLATCMELKGAWESPDATQYVSHLPVHQDGTCNGLQHYAALGGDSWGARQVNLVPGDRPADVYTAVADLVIESIAKDSAAGNRLAAALVGKIKRKVVKQTVMTNVYGVTFMGAKLQVKKQLDALYPDIFQETGIGSQFLASYIAVRIFAAMSTMFRGAHDIQHWLGEIGGKVCSAITPDQMNRLSGELEKASDEKKKVLVAPTGNPEYDRVLTKFNRAALGDLLSQFRSTIIWTTPLRMPVVQPYRKGSVKTVKTHLQSLVLRMSEPWDPVNKRKQLQAFPPNFVHSLDASHMMLSALECDANGLTFAAVHDSFWTHASDIKTMSNILRDAFIRIHSEDVIGRLADEFKARYKGSLCLVKLKANTDAGRAIMIWRRKHNFAMSHEMLLEKRRLELLASKNPEERAAGESLVTPASLYAKLSKGEDETVLEPEDLPTSMTAVPTRAQILVDGKASKKLSTQDSATDEHLGEVDDNVVEDDVMEEVVDEESDENDFQAACDTSKRMETLMGSNHVDLAISSKPKQQQAKPSHKNIPIWAPLKLPAIPKKGDFDVSQLKTSEYFFS